ncbi:cysteine--tRNA ligase [Sediminivirga luteola]
MRPDRAGTLLCATETPEHRVPVPGAFRWHGCALDAPSRLHTVTFQLYDTQTREARAFEPLNAPAVGIYVCGATVQGAPHLGHLRTAVAFDQLRRWLLYRGYRVTFIRNVTDIDDKILERSAAEGRPWWEHASHYDRQFNAAYDALGVLRPSYDPRATGHITEMIELIERLIERGIAYPALDGSGDVYFSAADFPEYGALTHQRLDDMAPAPDAPPAGKRDPRDFALWKAAKDGEPATASWPAPWGRGRPGWHIECSAMSTKYLGTTFDIHGGGLDLRFPHHENEQAQSRAAGDGFARYWVHAGLLNIGGEKMSKSLGNSVFAAEAIDEAGPLPLRYVLGAAHYRSVLDYDPEESLARAVPVIERLERFLRESRRVLDDELPAPVRAEEGFAGREVDVPEEFAAAMDNDLGVPAALSVLFSTLSEGQKLLDGRESPGQEFGALFRIAAQVQLMLEILGIDPTHPVFASDRTETPQAGVLERLVEELIAGRAAAREHKDFAAADDIRDLLARSGVELTDTPAGTRYTIKER